MGAVEEGVKAAGGFIDAMRNQPLVLMMGLMNIVLLLFMFYYLTRITARTETTVKLLFDANDSLYKQWGTVIKDQVSLTEKTMHCILPEDAIKLLQLPPRSEPPARPQAPTPLTPERQSWPPKWLPLDSDEVEWPLPTEQTAPLPKPRPPDAPTNGKE
jgi:hypothetical protein